MSANTVPRVAFPRLIVRNADAAIEYYRSAIGADLVERHAEPDGLVGYAQLALNGQPLALSEEMPDWGWLSPMTLGGSAVLIQLELGDCDETAGQMIAGGAEAVVPIADRPYGKREGRLRDPFGHLWVLSQELAS
ncbi:VOC family protein [Microbaculum marinum]|uniref:VOC family protein n=1 Tax=Microbaculum marinum TaxID=1764581 RepID=A0AAW9RLP6_9HYPH